MKRFEISSKENKNGKRNFKVILHTIFPDSCIDEVNQVGTLFNINGITWIRQYCEKALPSIKGMSLRCEFTDEERTEILGHGQTGIVDGEPTYEDAVVIGVFTKGYIKDIKDEDDNPITVCIGEGEIDAQCYHNFVTKLESDIANDIYPNGSIEFMRTPDNDAIVYKYGYKDEGRIPTEFVYSGYALLSIPAADNNARLIELNEQNKEDQNKMTDTEIKKLAQQIVDALSAQTSEINKIKDEYEKELENAKAATDQAIAEKNEVTATSEQIQQALDDIKKEYEELDQKFASLYDEKCTLQKALGEAKAKERIAKLQTAINDFSEDEVKYAQNEIEAFKEDPENAEVSAIVNKIWEGIGKTAKKNEKAVEQNSVNEDVVDIFSEVTGSNFNSTDDLNIF